MSTIIIGRDFPNSLPESLGRFGTEEVRCGVCWLDGKAVGGGPVEGDGIPPWIGDDEQIEVRSWRGNRDEVANR